jgi:hypothetical protein
MFISSWLIPDFTSTVLSGGLGAHVLVHVFISLSCHCISHVYMSYCQHILTTTAILRLLRCVWYLLAKLACPNTPLWAGPAQSSVGVGSLNMNYVKVIVKIYCGRFGDGGRAVSEASKDSYRSSALCWLYTIWSSQG